MFPVTALYLIVQLSVTQTVILRAVWFVLSDSMSNKFFFLFTANPV